MVGNRDDFTEATKWLLARRVGFHCSNPGCRKSTSGPHSDPAKAINLGEAAHITAAAPGPGAKRYDATLTSEQRRHESNGIWLCNGCADMIDKDEVQFPVPLLCDWRALSEAAAVRESQFGVFVIPTARVPLLEDIDGNPISIAPGADTLEIIRARVRRAAEADIAGFKDTPGWPVHTVDLGLAARDAQGPVEITDLAQAIRTARDVAVIAPPGTGKTTTLLQCASRILATSSDTAIFVPLGNWSSEGCGLLESVLKRRAFQAVSRQDLVTLAAADETILLLDGWNELDPQSRQRAFGEIERLRREYPLLRFVVSTRQQAQDLPFAGLRIEVLALSDTQQLALADSLAGDQGLALLDQAWRTPGVRDLVSIPLYLTVLLQDAPAGVMPTTKEEVLRLFVTRHERAPAHGPALDAVLFGTQHPIAVSLGVEGVVTGNSAISEARARTVVSEVENRLKADGQIGEAVQPMLVINILVDHHILVRSDGSVISFQHQQFQEWYASFRVEDLILAAEKGDMAARTKLLTQVFDSYAWEEAILFACERLSRSGAAGQAAVAGAILLAKAIDPMLAAQMIERSDETVWRIVADSILAFARTWHRPGSVDRAVRFMVTTGRPEFAAELWPLVSHADNQVRLGVLRAAPPFRAAVLGADREADLLTLPEDSRDDVFAELASNSGIDGMELAVQLATNDPSTTVRVSVIDALLFRRADRLAAQILKVSKPEVWEEIAKHGEADAFYDPEIVGRLKGIEAELARNNPSMLRRLEQITHLVDIDAQIEQDVETIVASPDFPADDKQAGWWLSQAAIKCPKAIAAGMTRRLEQGLEIPFRSRDLFAAAPLLDNGPIAELAKRVEARSEAGGCAASIIGPRTIGELMVSYLGLRGLEPGRATFTKEESEAASCWGARLHLTRSQPFVEAWLAHAGTDDPADIAALADLLALHGETDNRKLPFDISEAAKDQVAQVLLCWKDRVLGLEHPIRGHLAKISAGLARLARPAFADTIFELIDMDLRLRREQLAQFRQSRDRGISDVHMGYLNQYENHLAAVAPDEVRGRLKGYLDDPDFGVHAAQVLKTIDERPLPKPSEKTPGFGGPNFAGVRAKRAALDAGRAPADTTSVPLIWSVVERLIATEDEAAQMHALQLAAIAAFLPHAPRPDLNTRLLNAAVPWYAKKRFMLALILAGEVVPADMIVAGLDELLERAKKEPWRLDHNSHELDSWLELLPFSDRAEAVFDILPKLPDQRRAVWELRGMLRSLGNTPAANAAELLMRLADQDPRFCDEYEWLSALFAIDTPEAYLLLFERINANPRAFARLDGWTLTNHLEPLLTRDPGFRAELLRRYQDDAYASARPVLERALSHIADADTVRAMVAVYTRTGRPFDGALAEALRRAAVEQKPSRHWKGAYELHRVGIAALRKELFAQTAASGAGAELALRCLEHIDDLRDEYGRAEDEPRHPDSASGRPWPLVVEPAKAAV